MSQVRLFYSVFLFFMGLNACFASENTPESLKSQMQFDFKKELPCFIGVYNFGSPPYKSSLIYELRKFPENFSLDGLNVTCSIKMDNGAQIDYVPGKIAIWLGQKDSSPSSFFEQNLVLTGTIGEKDLYSLTAEEFSEKILQVDSICFAKPDHASLLDNGILSVQSPSRKMLI